jgi:hypothetical protein
MLDLTKVTVSKDYKDGLAETKTYGASSVSSKKPLKTEWFRSRGSSLEDNPNCIIGLTTQLADADGMVMDYLIVGEPQFQKTIETLVGEAKPVFLVQYQTSNARYGIWPVSARNSMNSAWITSAKEAVKQSFEVWTRISPNMANKCFDVFRTAEIKNNNSEFPEIKWDLKYNECISYAFHDRIIDEKNYETFHPLQRAIGGGNAARGIKK